MNDTIKTSVAYPWALAMYGGLELGKRFRTRLMFLTREEVTDGIVTGYFGRSAKRFPNGTVQLAKRDRRIPVRCVFEDWRHRPSPHQVREAKKKVPVCSAVYEYEERLK